jgi:hypothetical protein
MDPAGPVITGRLCAVPTVRRDRGTAQFTPCRIYAAWWPCHGVCAGMSVGSSRLADAGRG